MGLLVARIEWFVGFKIGQVKYGGKQLTCSRIRITVVRHGVTGRHDGSFDAKSLLNSPFITGDSVFGKILTQIRPKILEICQIFLQIRDQICVKIFLKIEMPVIK